MQKFNFVTDGSKVYRLGGNDWYAVTENNYKVLLVDTDCKVGDEVLKTPWSNGNCRGEDGENGQAILHCCNNLVNTYFSGIKHAIISRSVEAGTCKLENAYMWPMSYEEFEKHKVIGSKIVENSDSIVWTRTLSDISGGSYRYAWCVDSSGSDLYSGDVSYLYRVAPAFYLRKSAIDHIAEDGEIVLKPAITD